MTKIMQNGHNHIHTSLFQSNLRTVDTQNLPCQKYRQCIPDFYMHYILTSSILKLAVSYSSFIQTYMHTYKSVYQSILPSYTNIF